jgi:hypothetical protein
MIERRFEMSDLSIIITNPKERREGEGILFYASRIEFQTMFKGRDLMTLTVTEIERKYTQKYPRRPDLLKCAFALYLELLYAALTKFDGLNADHTAQITGKLQYCEPKIALICGEVPNWKEVTK